MSPRLPRPRHLGWLLALALSAWIVPQARARSIGIDEYRQRLERISVALDAKNLNETKQLSKALNGARVNFNGSEFNADASLLLPLANAANQHAADDLAPRVKLILKDLPAALAKPALAARSEGGELLGKLRRDEANPLPPRDGEIEGFGIADSGIWAWIRRTASDFYDWVAAQWKSLLKWLDGLVPKPKMPGTEGLGTFVNVVLIAAALGAIFLVVRILFRNRDKPQAVPEISTAPAPAKDADPLSRNSSEWEGYAESLAAKGRYREAIRAWYHAVLVTLFRAGILTYRKGRTNWEYCYVLPPEIGWRDRFMALTRTFEVEWYGKNQSSAEDLGACSAAARKILNESRSASRGSAA